MTNSIGVVVAARSETLIHAAELLERDAQIIADDMRDSEGDWWDPPAEEDYYDMLQTAAKLREMAEKEGV